RARPSRVRPGRLGAPALCVRGVCHCCQPARRDLHRRLAELVAGDEERARHLALATTPPDEEVAQVLEEAAELARSRGAWDAAGELLELARSFTPSTRLELARRRALTAAEYHIHAGDRSRGRLLLERLLVETPDGAVRSKALRLLAEVQY